MKKGWMLVAALAGAVMLSAACGGKTEDTPGSPEETGAVNEQFPDSRVTKLGKYKGVEIEAIRTEVTDEDIQGEIDDLLAAHPDTRPVEGKTVVEDGDTVNIDFTGYVDGETFEGGSTDGAGYLLTIGSHSFIDGFEDGLIGKEVGSTCTLDLSFPDPYLNNPDLSGVPVVFDVTVNDIVEFVDAKWDDEFVQTYTEYDSTDAFAEGMKVQLKEEKLQAAQEEREYAVIQAIIEDSEFDCAQSDLDAVKNDKIAEYETYASYAGMELKDFLLNYMNGLSEEAFEIQVTELAEFQVKSRLVIDAVTAAESITLTEQEYAEGLARLAQEYGAESGEAFEQQYGHDTVEETLIYDKTVDFVVGNAVEI